MLKNRTIFEQKLLHLIDTPVIKIVTGVRRCGKSYLLKLLAGHLQKQGVARDRIISIDFESIANRELTDYLALYDHIMRLAGKDKKRVYIMIDEIQEVKDWEKAARSLMVDLDCDLYLTGSNAHLLAGELATLLAGRYIELSLLPLSFKEYLDFNEVSRGDRASVEEAFYNFIKFGGFPAMHMLPDDEEIRGQYLKGIFNSVVLKDVIQRHDIRDSELLERILIYLMENIGNIFSAKKFADYLKSQGRKVSTDSVYNYIRALETALIIYTARRYDVKGKKVLERLEKYYLVDLGLRNAVLGNKTADISQALENIVYLELLRRGNNVYVGKEGELEVDFIACSGNQRHYYQVSYLIESEQTREREFRPLRLICDNFPKTVISLDKFKLSDSDGIEHMNLLDFLLIDQN
ncbi:MAG: ATP-binding protein [Candidatus Riflebacteria bacterium]|nr:ATP-binding protein [Candidatus Riflebacteria bacterium]